MSIHQAFSSPTPEEGSIISASSCITRRIPGLVLLRVDIIFAGISVMYFMGVKKGPRWKKNGGGKRQDLQRRTTQEGNFAVLPGDPVDHGKTVQALDCGISSIAFMSHSITSRPQKLCATHCSCGDGLASRGLFATTWRRPYRPDIDQNRLRMVDFGLGRCRIVVPINDLLCEYFSAFD